MPVATVAVGNARNAGLLAVRILAASDADLRQRMLDFQADLRATAQEKGKKVRASTSAARSTGQASRDSTRASASRRVTPATRRPSTRPAIVGMRLR